MGKKPLREFLEQDVVPKITELFHESGCLGPIYIVCAEGETFAVPAFPGGKDLSIMLMKAFLHLLEADRYIYADEAWVLEGKGTKEEMREIINKVKAAGGNVHDLPGRQEAIIFTGEDENEGMVLAQMIVNRDGKDPSLGPLVFKDYGINEGRMVGLLPRGNKTVQ
jgi:hypothetical protein